MRFQGKNNCSRGLRKFAMAKARGPGAAQSPVCQLAKIAQAEVLTNPCLRRSPTPPALAGLSVTFDCEAFFCWLPIAIPRGLFAFTCFPFDTAAISWCHVNTQEDFHVCSWPGTRGLWRLHGRIDTKEQPLRRRFLSVCSAPACFLQLEIQFCCSLHTTGTEQGKAFLVSETRHCHPTWVFFRARPRFCAAKNLFFISPLPTMFIDFKKPPSISSKLLICDFSYEDWVACAAVNSLS